jgi:hypothetical protein
MTLKEATDRAGAAIEARNLEALALALKARREALESGERPTIDVLEAGERAIRALKVLARCTAFESARVGQIKRYVDFRR